MRNLFKSFIMFFIAFALFTTVVYAWFTNTTINEVQPVNVDVMRRDVELDIEYGKNGGSYTSFDEPAELNAYLQNSLPADFVNVRVTIRNNNDVSAPDMQVELSLKNVRASLSDLPYDLTDFFYLENANIKLTWYSSLVDYENDTSYLIQNIALDTISDDEVIYQGLPLYNERLSNLFDYTYEGEELVVTNNISILDPTNLPSLHIIVVEFVIGFDPYTPNQGVGIQDGELLIDGLYSFIGEED
ncbi:MAG: hypothetical protein RBT45_06260 [Acholeplasmataceae bacterium]|nr:hypothetical protein [Acholeplasmataceae bacterium]